MLQKQKSQNLSDYKHKCIFPAYIKCPLLTAADSVVFS